MLGGKLLGDASAKISEIATLEDAGAKAISWVGGPRFLKRAEKSDAAALLIPIDLNWSTDRPCVAVSDPDMAVCHVLQLFAPPPDRPALGVASTATVAPDAKVEGATIAPGAYVGARARIGAGTVLYPGVYVGSDTGIGRDCILWPNVVVRERCSVGDRVVIHPNSTIGADGFGYLFRDGVHHKIPQTGRVVIEDDVEIGAHTSVDRARSGETRIGCGTKIDNHVQIAHNCRIGAHCMIVAQSGLAGSSTLGDHVLLAGRAAIVDHVHVGTGVQVGGASLVFKDVPDGARVHGVPAVEYGIHLRQQAALRRLPGLLRQFRDLTRRLESLESAAHE